MSISTTAKTYAGVLLDIGKEKGSLDLLLEEISSFADIVDAEEGLRVFLNVPGIDVKTKTAFLQKTLNSAFSSECINFLCVLVENGRHGEIRDIERSLRMLIDEEKRSLRVTVVSGFGLDDELRAKVSTALGQRYNKSIIIEEEVDPSILGGIIIKAGDTVIDGSVLTRVRTMKDKLMLSNIRGEAVYEN